MQGVVRRVRRHLGSCGLAFVVAASLAAGSSARAQDYPTRPIRIVMGFGPGGLGDITSRIIAEKMTQSMGVPVTIENMPGPGGINAASTVARAAPDGYTILLASGQNAISSSMFRSLPYDPVNDFQPITNTGVYDFVIMVKNDSPYKTAADLIASAKKDPAHFNVGNINAGSAQNLTALLFISKAGLTVPTVPFRSTGEVVGALMAGEVQAVFETMPGAMGHVQGKSVRALAVTGDKPSDFLPGVPTVTDSGLKDYVVSSWTGFVAPAKTPKEIVAKLNREIGKAIMMPDVVKRFRELGLTPDPGTPEALWTIYKDDIQRWRTVITDAKLGQN